MKKIKLFQNWSVELFFGAIFFFVVALGVNGYMVYISILYSPNLVTSNYYQKGVEYDKQLIKKERFQNFANHIGLSKASDSRWFFENFPQDSLSITKATITFYRPSNSSLDTSFVMTLDPKHTWTTPPVLLEKGKWLAFLHLQTSKGPMEKKFPLEINFPPSSEVERKRKRTFIMF